MTFRFNYLEIAAASSLDVKPGHYGHMPGVSIYLAPDHSRFYVHGEDRVCLGLSHEELGRVLDLLQGREDVTQLLIGSGELMLSHAGGEVVVEVYDHTEEDHARASLAPADIDRLVHSVRFILPLLESPEWRDLPPFVSGGD